MNYDNGKTWKALVYSTGAAPELYPATSVLPKGLLAIYDKPLIYYPLSALMLAGIRDFAILAPAVDCAWYRRALDHGQQFGVQIDYRPQELFVAACDSLLCARDFIGDCNFAVISVDCVVFAEGLQAALARAMSSSTEATVLAHPVHEPSKYTVVTLRKDGSPSEIVDRPVNGLSSLAIMGLSFYRNQALNSLAAMHTSPRASLTDFHQLLISRNTLDVQQCGRGFAWLDTSSHAAIVAAANCIESIESTHGLKIGCLEEIAYRRGYLSGEQILTENRGHNCGYASYLVELVRTLPLHLKDD